MKHLGTLFIAAVVVLVTVASTCLFTVTQGQDALVSRFGVFVENTKDNSKTYAPGLHFKRPIIDKVLKFDTRLQSYDQKTSRIMTAEKKDVLVDYYVKWRISDLPLYYTSIGGDPGKVQKLVDQQVDDNLRAQFGKRTIPEVISDDRTVVMRILRDSTSNDVEKLGVKIIDVRIKAIDLPKETSQAIYANMRAEREEAAKSHRAEGMAKAHAIRAEADAEATVIVATSKEMADKTRASGDARAAEIYAEAYGEDSEFYAFYRSLEAYQQTFSSDSDNLLVVSPSGQFFNYYDKMGKQNVEH